MAFYQRQSEQISNQIEKAYKIGEKVNLIPPIFEQRRYNMLYRNQVDSQYRDLFKDYIVEILCDLL